MSPRSLVPADLDAEAHLIGALAYTPAKIPEIVASGLEPGHFYDPANGALYAKLCEADDPYPLWWDAPYYQLVEEAPQVSRPDLYAAQILLAASRRDLLRAARDAQQAILDGDMTALADARGRLEGGA